MLDEAADGTEFVQWGESKISAAQLSQAVSLRRRPHHDAGQKTFRRRAQPVVAGAHLEERRQFSDSGRADERPGSADVARAGGGVDRVSRAWCCVVSHDRYFLNRVCTDILAFEGDGKIHHSVGDYDYYLEKKRRRTEAARPMREPALEETVAALPAGVAPRPAKARQTFLQGSARIGRHGAANSRRGRGDCADRGLVCVAGFSSHPRDARPTNCWRNWPPPRKS